MGDGGGWGMELPGDRRKVADVQGGDVMLSVIWERAGMGFLEGTGADASPERIGSLGLPAKRGFGGEDCQGAMGQAGGDGSASVPALVQRQVAARLSLGNIFMHGN